MIEQATIPFKAPSRMILTPTEEINKAISEVDLNLFRQDFLENYCQGIINRIKMVISPKLRHLIKIRVQQFDFLEDIKHKMQTLPIESQALIFLGAFQFIQGRLLKFDSSGPLFRMVLKKADLERIIGEFVDEFNIEQLIHRPRLINEQADLEFTEFIASNQDIVLKWGILKDILE